MQKIDFTFGLSHLIVLAQIARHLDSAHLPHKLPRTIKATTKAENGSKDPLSTPFADMTECVLVGSGRPL